MTTFDMISREKLRPIWVIGTHFGAPKGGPMEKNKNKN